MTLLGQMRYGSEPLSLDAMHALLDDVTAAASVPGVLENMVIPTPAELAAASDADHTRLLNEGEEMAAAIESALLPLERALRTFTITADQLRTAARRRREELAKRDLARRRARAKADAEAVRLGMADSCSLLDLLEKPLGVPDDLPLREVPLHAVTGRPLEVEWAVGNGWLDGGPGATVGELRAAWAAGKRLPGGYHSFRDAASTQVTYLETGHRATMALAKIRIVRRLLTERIAAHAVARP